MGKSCKELARSLFDCMKDVPCVKNGGDMKQCLNSPDAAECQVLRNAYSTCKIEGLNMRNRIRGEKVY
jgi:hypothetical protein